MFRVEWKPTFVTYQDIANDILLKYNGPILKITRIKNQKNERYFYVYFNKYHKRKPHTRGRWEPESMLQEVYPDFLVHVSLRNPDQSPRLLRKSSRLTRSQSIKKEK